MATTTFTRAQLEALVASALRAANTEPSTAGDVARALVQAEIDGQGGHGLSRVASYCAQARSGKVDGTAQPGLRMTRPGTASIDVANGFAYPAFELMIEALPQMARVNGIAAAGFVRSHHAGVLGWHVERLAEKGIVAIAFANTPHAMTAWGGKSPLYGTNPIAFAAPRRAAPPLVIDLALSHVARGKIQAAAQKGESIPDDWAFDAEGRPTTDATAALKGTLAPSGGAKGAALALMVEVLAAALIGANFSRDATSFFDGEGAPPGVGQLFVGLAPDAFSDHFIGRIEALAATIEGDDGARLPGTKRVLQRAIAAERGIAVDRAVIDAIEKLAAG